MRALVLTDEVRAAVAKVREYADANPMSWAEVQARATGAIKGAVGDNELLRVEIPMGYRVIYSTEYQRALKLRHISVSVSTKGKYPHELAFAEIVKLFGFTDLMKAGSGKIWIEEVAGGGGAINAMQPF